MALTAPQVAAFQCQTGPSDGEPHGFEYRGRPNGKYLCRKCLVEFSKTRLKELTDGA